MGNRFVYRRAQSALATLQSAADMLLSNAAGDVRGSLVVHMLEQSALSEADVDSHQKLIDAQIQSLKRRGDR
jgi:predicted transcriptional regulator